MPSIAGPHLAYEDPLSSWPCHVLPDTVLTSSDARNGLEGNSYRVVDVKEFRLTQESRMTIGALLSVRGPDQSGGLHEYERSD